MKGVYNNITQEIPHWEFYDTRCRVVSSWQSKLSRVLVESNDTAAVNKFYGALYRASFLPRAFSDKDIVIHLCRWKKDYAAFFWSICR